ncbi:AraC family transcriptional regulator [Pedobacter yulinensis]|uniref:AraC family transcriptional regulator n=1 Tax=Pedobacter yulinensis TaxID=2126353 RepID=A0A2T3HIG6_9SPHI|nr:helix-turn-helix domain-containing protein [Pedobacter yulinensis]PST82222.1 AraC family transcriptional regulator [Pedobacter yulinensis]
MVNVLLLLTAKHRLISTAVILDVLDTVNVFHEQENGSPFFDISIAALPGDLSAASLYKKYRRIAADERPRTSLLLIPAFESTDIHEALRENRHFVPFIRDFQQQGTEIASFCTGAFLLAETGLLNGRRATTHVQMCRPFSALFPRVQLDPGAVITDQEGIYTGGGATSTFHLLIYLIEKYCGRQMAVKAAKFFAIDLDRIGQSYFGVIQPERAHGDELVMALQDKIEETFSRSLVTIEDMTGSLPSCKRNLLRRFKKALNMTPIEYLQRTRIEAARQMLENRNEGIADVMFRCGYSDPKTFRKLFKRNTGLTPKAYRDKYNRASA